MANDTFLAVMLTSMIALFFGFVLTFSGYRFFLVLLPIWGFFYGFGFGAQSIQAFFGDAFLSTVSSWVVGFLVAAVFALCSYLFYFFAVGVVSFSLGYSIGVGLMEAIGFNFGFIVWIVGVALGGVILLVTFKFNLQKYVIIAATAILGAGVIVGTFLYLFGGLPTARLTENAVQAALLSSPFWLLVFLGIALVGAVVQYQSTKMWEREMNEALSGLGAEGAPPAAPPAAPPTTPPAAPPAPDQGPPTGQPIAS
jgi:hypothetical protein